MSTTKEVWSALPYQARRALIPADLDVYDGLESVDLDVWTNDRIQVTPWTLLPSVIREVLHTTTTCAEME